MLAQPGADARLRHALIGPERAVDLIAHLEGVAPVDEDGGFLRHHHRAPRRAEKAGQPGEALRIGADIFGEMLVGERHDETGERILRKLGAQRAQAIFIGGHGRAILMRFVPT
jgi:hypothetical protein